MRAPGQTGAGHAPEDTEPNVTDDENSEHAQQNILEAGHEAHLEAGYANEFNHEAVDVPEGHSPFGTEEIKDDFIAALEMAREMDAVPYGYGLHPEEQGEEGYPTLEIIRSAKRGRREVEVGLPDHIWRPRAILWAQGLDVMTRILEDA